MVTRNSTANPLPVKSLFTHRSTWNRPQTCCYCGRTIRPRTVTKHYIDNNGTMFIAHPSCVADGLMLEAIAW